MQLVSALKGEKHALLLLHSVAYVTAWITVRNMPNENRIFVNLQTCRPQVQLSFGKIYQKSFLNWMNEFCFEIKTSSCNNLV